MNAYVWLQKSDLNKSLVPRKLYTPVIFLLRLASSKGSLICIDLHAHERSDVTRSLFCIDWPDISKGQSNIVDDFVHQRGQSQWIAVPTTSVLNSAPNSLNIWMISRCGMKKSSNFHDLLSTNWSSSPSWFVFSVLSTWGLVLLLACKVCVHKCITFLCNPKFLQEQIVATSANICFSHQICIFLKLMSQTQVYRYWIYLWVIITAKATIKFSYATN